MQFYRFLKIVRLIVFIFKSSNQLDYVPDVYDELLTQSEIQSIINKINSEYLSLFSKKGWFVVWLPKNSQTELIILS